jgi:hypothetical protein
MLSLAEQQQCLLAILQGRPVDTNDDAWLESVTESRELILLREIASWWQQFQIEWQCRYTSRLMKRMGCFPEYVAAHFRENPTLPSIEELTTQFLSSLQNHQNPLLHAVAAFELACIAFADNPELTATINWDRNPEQVMKALNSFEPLPELEPGTRYVLQIGAEFPGGVSCVRETHSEGSLYKDRKKFSRSCC